MFKRLMERPGVDAKRSSKAPPFWGGGGVTRDGAESSVDIGQTEYITRLTALRDSLIDQEQMYLAQALDRLRIHSLSNKSSSYRLRMNGDDVSKGSGSSSSRHAQQTPRTNMVTTVEKFRQMRPKRHPPVIFPLQGRQLFDSHPQKEKDDSSAEGQTKGSNSSNGSISSRTAKDSEVSARSLPSKIDETVQANLQRLLQPTSSIPNIGRKALKKQQSFEPKTRAILYANDNSNSNSGTNRFITRPRVNIPKRPPSLASPDSIIAAVTNYNSIYSMNNNNHYYHNHSGMSNNNNNTSGGRRTGNDLYEETGSETDSINGMGVVMYNEKTKGNHNGHMMINAAVPFDPDSSPSVAVYDSNGQAELGHASLSELGHQGPEGDMKNSLYRPEKKGAPCYTQHRNNAMLNKAVHVENGASDNNAVEGEFPKNHHLDDEEALDIVSSRNVHNNSNINRNNYYNGISHHGSATRKLYRNSGASEHTSGVSKPSWQRAPHPNDSGRSKQQASNYSSISTSRSDSHMGSTISGGHVSTYNKEGVRNSIDIFLPSHPFGTPFVRTESNLSRGDTGESWIHVNNPAAESIQPGTRFPAITGSQNRPRVESQGQPQSQPPQATNEGRRSRSSSRGDSSLPNVRVRYPTRRRSNSTEDFPEETERSRPWARASQSQGGSRGGISNSVTDENNPAYQKRHIVVDMPSIIFNAASPEVGGEAVNSTPSLEVNPSPGQGSTPHSRAGQSSSGAATPTPTPSVPNLSKAVKQKEIRKRELQNLLEDVRELNIRTEVLSSQSAQPDGPGGGDGGRQEEEEMYRE